MTERTATQLDVLLFGVAWTASAVVWILFFYALWRWVVQRKRR
jgi:hypothetical protein